MIRDLFETLLYGFIVVSGYYMVIWTATMGIFVLVSSLFLIDPRLQAEMCENRKIRKIEYIFPVRAVSCYLSEVVE